MTEREYLFYLAGAGIGVLAMLVFMPKGDRQAHARIDLLERELDLAHDRLDIIAERDLPKVVGGSKHDAPVKP